MTYDHDEDNDERDLVSDDEHDDTSSQPVNQYRAHQHQLFTEWMQKTAAEGGFVKRDKDGHTQPTTDADLSLKGLVAKQESTEIIHNPRDYQLELFEKAKQQNLIAVLDTGTGKTLIAVMLVRWVIDEELEARSKGAAPRVVFFLVPSVNLVLQQTAVLEANLNQPIKSLYGALNVDFWSEADWRKMMLEYRIIVCTAEILRRALDKHYISISDINLLVFDEAHHTKQNHPYARIVKDHYLTAPESALLPRIMGMTASPVDAKGDVSKAASQLETLLSSRIMTTGELSSLQSSHRPVEIDVHYNSRGTIWTSPLANDLLGKLHEVPVLQQEYNNAKIVAEQLGTWCADRSMLHSLSQRSRQHIEFELEKKYRHGHRAVDVKALDAAKARYDDMLAYIQRQCPSSVPPPTSDVWSNKVSLLKEILDKEYHDPSEHRCLVFVERKSTARLLSMLFDAMDNRNIRCSYLVGASGHGMKEEEQQSFKQQVMTLAKFRNGDLNVLFATSVAEEGLDVPMCNLVIRFDLYRTMIQYIQSRGRARHTDSRFIHMLNTEVPAHLDVRRNVAAQEIAMRDWCRELPQDRRLTDDDAVLDQLLFKDRPKRVFIHPETQARLNYNNSLQTLQHFIDVWPTDSDEPRLCTFVPISGSGGFQFEVVLPVGAPLRSAIGRPCSKKIVAKQSASFDMCIELYQQGYLDGRFQSTRTKQVHAMRNAHLAVDNKANKDYPMLTKPRIWTNERGLKPQQLYIAQLEYMEDPESAPHPIVLLTRSPLPSPIEIPLFYRDGRRTIVVMLKPQLIAINEEQLHLITDFTFRMFMDVFSKTYESKAELLSYFLAPATTATKADIDWSLLQLMVTPAVEKWTSDTDSVSLVDKLLIDPWDGARKFSIEAMHPSLTPQSAVPADAAKFKWRNDILDYSIALHKKSRARFTWTPDQPVYIVELLDVRRDMLKPATAAEMAMNRRAYICPEPMRISRIPVSLAKACLAWPSIIWRIEATLIALEACQQLGIDSSPALALIATTKDTETSAIDETFKTHHGMGENYERLEFLGDCFLKTAVTIAVFVKFPTFDPSGAHDERMPIISNKNLLDVSHQLGLAPYIRSKPFSRRLWYPEGLHLLEGKGAATSNDKVYHNQKHALSDKTIADVSEALMAAAFLTNDVPGQWSALRWDNAVKAVTVLVGRETHDMQCWSDYVDAYTVPDYQTREATASQKEMAWMMGEAYGYHFKSATLLRSAFLHASHPSTWESLKNYERLEYLGDALLDLAAVSYLFYTYPDQDPDWLTQAKSLVVGNAFFSYLSIELGFQKFLRHNSPSIRDDISKYVTKLEEINDGAVNYWTKIAAGPKCLSDIIEAYVGAMFIDSNFDFAQVQRFFDTYVKRYFTDFTLYPGAVLGKPITVIHHMLQNDVGCREFRVITGDATDDMQSAKTMVVALMVHENVVAFDYGISARYALERMAGKALHLLKGLSTVEIKHNYGCTCKSKRAADE